MKSSWHRSHLESQANVVDHYCPSIQGTSNSTDDFGCGLNQELSHLIMNESQKLSFQILELELRLKSYRSQIDDSLSR